MLSVPVQPRFTGQVGPGVSPKPLKNIAKTKGLKGRPQGRKQAAWTPIRSSRLDPNTIHHFPQNLKISSKMFPFWVPIYFILGTFFKPFSKKWCKGSKVHPQSVKKMQKWSPRVPKWSPTVSQWSPKVSKSYENGRQGYPNGAQRCPDGAPRSKK